MLESSCTGKSAPYGVRWIKKGHGLVNWVGVSTTVKSFIPSRIGIMYDFLVYKLMESGWA
jgi:hypothetical protein